MADTTKPILRVEASAEDFSAKVVKGASKETLQPVDAAFRTALTAKIAATADALPAVGPAAVRITLLERAWAKSNRPNRLLQQLRLPVVGAEAIGELIVQAERATLTGLSDYVANNTSAAGERAISAITDVSPWNAEDVTGGLETASLARPTLPEHSRIRVEFFPWANPEQVLGALALQRSESDRIFTVAGQRENAAVAYIRAPAVEQAEAIARHAGVRRMAVEPAYGAGPIVQPQAGFRPVGRTDEVNLPNPPEGCPVVAVVDSGVRSDILEPWVYGRQVYVVPPDTDHLHGTFVAGLVSNARAFNASVESIPPLNACVLDVACLGAGLTYESDLLAAIEDAIRRYPEVRVWNCSFGANTANVDGEFGTFARALDRISANHRVLFVVSAGNYSCDPWRSWPCEDWHYPEDRISMPAEAVNALTVSSIAHIDGWVNAGEPAPYSRRGPGPAFTVKPDVTHHGGSVTRAGDLERSGVISVLPDGLLAEGMGTSFSAPLVAALAANIWASLERRGMQAPPELVKALVIHAAAINSGKQAIDARDYVGWGLPFGLDDALFCDPGSFTLLFDVQLPSDEWSKRHFPIPPALRTAKGALACNVTVTMCYSPPLNPLGGEEYVQHEVELSFGVYEQDDEGAWHQRGRVPLDRPVGADTTEKARLSEGLKYAPVKVFQREMTRVEGEEWRLFLSLTRRDDRPPQLEQRVFVLVTLQALDDSQVVYEQGVAAIPNNWLVSPLVVEENVRIRA